jgi:hypothetical protein
MKSGGVKMNYISTIVKQNKKTATNKKVAKKNKAPKLKPLLILYKSKDPFDAQIFVCLPEDEERCLEESGDQVSKEDFKRIVLTEINKSSEGWLFDIKPTKPGLIL